MKDTGKMGACMNVNDRRKEIGAYLSNDLHLGVQVLHPHLPDLHALPVRGAVHVPGGPDPWDVYGYGWVGWVGGWVKGGGMDALRVGG